MRIWYILHCQANPPIHKVRIIICKFENFREGINFTNTSHMRSFVKIKPSQNGEIILSFTDMGNPCRSRELLTSQICLLTLFAKIKFSQKFPNLQIQTKTQTSGMALYVSIRIHWRLVWICHTYLNVSCLHINYYNVRGFFLSVML